MSTASANPRRRFLELVQAHLPRPTATAGRCATCHSPVLYGEKHVRLRGEVYHSRCARYGGRAPSL